LFKDDTVIRKEVENMILEQNQSFITETTDGDVMTIKIEHVDSFGSNGSVNYVDEVER